MELSNGICDFCSAPDVTWRYPASNFAAYIADGFVGESIGDWASCAECRDLIDADDREGLAQRSIDRLIAANPDMAPDRKQLLQYLRGLHSMFFSNRVGRAAEV